MVYWISTGLVSAMLLASAWSYLFHASTIEGVRGLGFPDYFRMQLAVLKVIAVGVLLIAPVPLQVKEWAYAGVALFLLTAIVAHAAQGDPVWFHAINVLFLVLLFISNIYLPR